MKKLILFIIFLLLAVPIFAEPTLAIKALMDDSVSMLDWGIFKLENMLNSSFLAEKFNISIKVYYVWNSNRLIIYADSSLSQTDQKKMSEQEGKEWCKNVVKGIKFSVGIDPNTVGGRGFKGSSYLSVFFSHVGFSRTDTATEKIAEELDNITEIRVLLLSDRLVEDVGILICVAPLRGTRIMFEED